MQQKNSGDLLTGVLFFTPRAKTMRRCNLEAEDFAPPRSKSTADMKADPHKISRTASETVLSNFCAHLIETCWLLAVLIVPVLYDPHAQNSFDPIKVAAMRVLGLTVAGCLFVRMWNGFPRRTSVSNFSSFASWPYWFLAGVMVLLSSLVATLFSVEPRNSLWGAPYFVQGTFTLGCQFALFVGVATHLRSKEQMERLVAVALTASAPFAIYALIQRGGLDPLFWGNNDSPAFSFAGWPIYLAGYLLMLIPLCVWKFWRSLDPSAPRPQALLYAILLLLQVTAFFSADKRGPQVALLVATALSLLLLAAYRRRFKLATWGLGIAAAGGLSLVLLAGLGKAGVPLQTLPLIGRLSMVVPVGAETGDAFRASLWAKAPDLVMATTPFVFPDGTPDRWHWLRSMIGYGPESLAGVLSRYWLNVEGGPALIAESRFHNTFWETWESVGWIGLLGFFWFYASIFSMGCKSLGLLAPNGGGFRLGIAAMVSGLILGTLLSGIFGPGYFGLGFQFGFVAGLVLWTLKVATRSPAVTGSSQERPYQFLVIALLAALLGHEIDMAFLFPTGNTAVMFWVFGGAIVGWGLRRIGTETANEELPSSCEIEPTEREALPAGSAWISAGLLTGLFMASILVVLLNGFIDFRSFQPATAGNILIATLTQIQFNHGPSHLILLLFLPSWLIGIFCIGSVMQTSMRTSESRKAFILAGVLSLGIAFAFAGLKAQWIATLGPIPAASASAAAVVTQAVGFSAIGATLLIVLALTAAATAAIFLLQIKKRTFAPAGISAWVAAGLAGLLVCTTAWWTAGNNLRTEAFSGWANVLDLHGRKALAATLYQEALKNDPGNVPNRIMCAKVLMESVERSENEKVFSEGMEKAESVLLPARQFSELNFGNYYLGRLYLRWALRERGEARPSLALRAKEALRRATNFAPEAETAWFEASIVDRQLLGDAPSADAKLARADKLTRGFNATPWGDFYAQQSFSNEDAQLKKFYAGRAIGYFNRALLEEWNDSKKRKLTNADIDYIQTNHYRTLLTKGALHRNLGEKKAAISCFLEATKGGSKTEIWEAEALLARTYADLGDRAAALRHVINAIAGAPPKMVADLENLKLSLSDPAPAVVNPS